MRILESLRVRNFKSIRDQKLQLGMLNVFIGGNGSGKSTGSDSTFTAHALSDGTLRFICLAILFLQPDPPPVILIDEPELGLHPAAIALLADLLQATATRVQVLAATQSVTLVNQLTPEEVWVVDRAEGASVFRHLKAEDMSSWLEDYALGELWEKNLLGGRP